MAVIFESKHFRLDAHDRPHVSRADGGHLVINPKINVPDRTHLSAEQAIDLARLTMAAGEAMQRVLPQRGIDIGRINYQDNGNWRHELHVHLYGRARSAKLQRWGTFLQLPPTPEAFAKEMGNLERLNDGDVAALKIEMERLLATEKYRSFG